MLQLLFVCSSDRTRAPIATALFLQAAKEAGLADWTCDSAGLRTYHGQRIADGVAKVLAEVGLEPRRLGIQQLTPKLIKASDLILCMTRDQEREITSNFISARNKTKTLMSILREDKDIFDPNKLPIESFRSCREMMMPAIKELVQRLM